MSIDNQLIGGSISQKLAIIKNASNKAETKVLAFLCGYVEAKLGTEEVQNALDAGIRAYAHTTEQGKEREMTSFSRECIRLRKLAESFAADHGGPYCETFPEDIPLTAISFFHGLVSSKLGESETLALFSQAVDAAHESYSDE